MAHWNARFGEQLAIVWVNSPKWMFAISETVAFLLLTYLITAIALRSAVLTGRLIRFWSLSVCLFYLLWPRFETLFWTTGGSEYLQPLAMTLGVLLPFLVEDAEAMIRTSFRYTLLLATALLAGGSFENVGPALLLYMGIKLAQRRRRGEPTRRLAGLTLSYTAGWIALLAAPSTRIRSEYYRQILKVPPLSHSFVVQRAIDVFRVSNKTNALLMVGLGIISIAMLLRQKQTPALRRDDWLMMMIGFVPALVVIAAPYTEPRAFQLLSVVFLVMILRFALQLQRSRETQRWLRWGCGVTAVLFALGTLRMYSRFADEVTARSRAIVLASHTSQCQTGIPISLIDTGITNRLLNSREIWVQRELNQVEYYFGCRLVVVNPW